MMAMVRKGGFEPPRLSAPPPQDGVSASSTTSAQKRGAQICQRSSWRKLAKFVNPKLLLYFLHTRHHAFKPLLTEELMLSLLEILPQRVIFIARNDLVQRRKENSILSCFMRRIHPDKLMQGGCELLFIATRFETTSG